MAAIKAADDKALLRVYAQRVRWLLIGVLAGTLVGVSGGAADSPDKQVAQDFPPKPRPAEAARSGVRDFLAPLTRPDTKRVQIRIRYCRRYDSRWHTCRTVVHGATTCRALVRARYFRDYLEGDWDYAAWIPRMRCRLRGRYR